MEKSEMIEKDRSSYFAFMKEAEYVRERGLQMQQAIGYFWHARLIACKNGWWEEAVSALCGQMLVAYLQYMETGNSNLLAMMYADIAAAEALARKYKVSGYIRAVLEMRYAQYCCEIDDLPHAYQHSVKSLEYLPEGEQKPEVLGHAGLIEVLHGLSPKKGLSMLEKASAMIERITFENPEHGLIVKSGNHLRFAAAYAHLGKSSEFAIHLNAAKKMANVLNKKFKFPHRLRRVQQLQQKNR